jgi:glucose-6-phosphate 1-dehydrogenase
MSHTIVIFGASGDLTSRKLIPALYSLARKKRLPHNTRIVGFSRTKYSHDQWRSSLGESSERFLGSDFDSDTWRAFAKSIYYHPGDIKNTDDFARLNELLDELESDESAGRLYYLSTAPQFYEPAVAHLGQHGMANESDGARRIVVEKPIGTDLTSARRLNANMHKVFDEQQVFRIDHYLGKETVQNMLVLRFANTIFEPIWNRNYIDNVQITVAEEVTVGRRGGYYDQAGVLRDMFQNHLLQLLMVTAMEVPARFDANLVRDEKVKVLQAIRPLDTQQVAERTVRGQYDGYLDEEGVPPGSQTATFAALHLSVDSWRWQGVPFYLRSGKAMSCRTTQIVIQFREPPHMMFAGTGQRAIDANRMVVQVQPAEGIQIHFQSKVPDTEMNLRTTQLDFRFSQHAGIGLPDAYQPLLLDALEGDASLFARSDEVELAWGIIDPIIAAWIETGQPELATYEPGFWGPSCCTDWMRQQGREWFDTCPVLK